MSQIYQIHMLIPVDVEVRAESESEAKSKAFMHTQVTGTGFETMSVGVPVIEATKVERPVRLIHG